MSSTRKARRAGNVVVSVAAGAGLFIGLLALVIDVGTWYETRSRVQVVADLAVRAALREAPEAASVEDLQRRAQSTCLRTFAANGLGAYTLTLSLEVSGDGRRATLVARGDLRRYFSRGAHSPRLTVRAVAVRDGTGRVLLAP